MFLFDLVFLIDHQKMLHRGGYDDNDEEGEEEEGKRMRKRKAARKRINDNKSKNNSNNKSNKDRDCVSGEARRRETWEKHMMARLNTAVSRGNGILMRQTISMGGGHTSNTNMCNKSKLFKMAPSTSPHVHLRSSCSQSTSLSFLSTSMPSFSSTSMSIMADNNKIHLTRASTSHVQSYVFNKRYTSSFCGRTTSYGLSMPRFPLASALSTTSSPPASEEYPALSDVLSSEIAFEKEEFEDDEELEKGPPSPWSLEMEDDSTLLLLTRTYGDEKVTIEFYAIDDDEDDDDDDLEDYDDLEEDEDADEQMSENGKNVSETKAVDGEDGEDDEDIFDDDVVDTMEFYVTISKTDEADDDESKRLLQFSCKCDGAGSFDIKKVEYFTQAFNEFPYSGPAFDSLEPELKDAFMGYLFVRGVDDDLANYIFDLKDYKENKQYIAWLEKVSAFVK